MSLIVDTKYFDIVVKTAESFGMIFKDSRQVIDSSHGYQEHFLFEIDISEIGKKHNIEFLKNPLILFYFEIEEDIETVTFAASFENSCPLFSEHLHSDLLLDLADDGIYIVSHKMFEKRLISGFKELLKTVAEFIYHVSIDESLREKGFSCLKAELEEMFIF